MCSRMRGSPLPVRLRLTDFVTRQLLVDAPADGVPSRRASFRRAEPGGGPRHTAAREFLATRAAHAGSGADPHGCIHPARSANLVRVHNTAVGGMIRPR